MICHAVPLVATARKYATTMLTVAQLRQGKCIIMQSMHNGRPLNEAGMLRPVPANRTAAPLAARRASGAAPHTMKAQRDLLRQAFVTTTERSSDGHPQSN